MVNHRLYIALAFMNVMEGAGFCSGWLGCEYKGGKLAYDFGDNKMLLASRFSIIIIEAILILSTPLIRNYCVWKIWGHDSKKR